MSFNGTWKIEIPTPMGKQQAELLIVHTNELLSGTATAGEETVPFINPAVSGNTISWTQNVTKPLKLEIKFELTREGDNLSGKAKPGILPAASVTGRRIC